MYRAYTCVYVYVCTYLCLYVRVLPMHRKGRTERERHPDNIYLCPIIKDLTYLFFMTLSSE